jgi:hypothetical protein
MRRDIRVMVSSNLGPRGQCSKAAGTAAAVLGQISRAFHYRERHTQTFVNLYKQYVRPCTSSVSDPTWSLLYRPGATRLSRTRRALAKVSGLRGATYEEKLEELGMTTLEERRHRADMVQKFKILTGKHNVNRESWFTIVAEGAVRTRQAMGLINLAKPRTRLDVRGNFLHQSSRRLEKHAERHKNGTHCRPI